MRIVKTIPFFILLLLISTNCFAQFDPAKKKAEKLIEPLMDIYPGLSIAVGVEDKVVWARGFGLADVEAKSLVKTDNQFRYYSLSKSITGLALAKLIDSKKLDINKSIRLYLEDLPHIYDSVKVKHLINHTSGIRNYNKGEWIKISKHNCNSASEALGIFINDSLNSKSGEIYSYSSFGYVLLSRLIEVLGGQNFEEYISSQLFQPLNLDGIALDRSTSLNNEVKYYSKWNAKKIKGKEEANVNNTCKFGAGSFVGTAQDLVKLYLNVLNQKVLTPETTSMYFSQILKDSGESTNYAFGIGDAVSSDGIRYHSHSGSALGANAILFIYPENKVVIVMLSNLNNKAINNKIGEIANLFNQAAKKK